MRELFTEMISVAISTFSLLILKLCDIFDILSVYQIMYYNNVLYILSTIKAQRESSHSMEQHVLVINCYDHDLKDFVNFDCLRLRILLSLNQDTKSSEQN